MPGRGRAPKPPEQRRRRNLPGRGEWLELESVGRAKILPTLPKRPSHLGRWSARTRSTWTAWRSDPATTQYGPADVAAAVDLAWLFEEYARGTNGKMASEVRLRMDALGLTPRGKRDLRWRLPGMADAPPAEMPDEVAQARARRERVRAIDPSGNP